ncbi:MFS transporter [Yoonia sp. SS1-5]|uniref:MFS transporter n=1 Tax=Yoonia rhodophyticola TaxID=3137370 RepID=A0AAN0M9K7_9RHOB
MNPHAHHDPGTSPAIGPTLAVLAISSLTIMANATIAPSLPGLAQAFADVPNVETLLGLLLSLPSLAIILTAGLAGIIADKIGRKPVLYVSLILYALGGASGLVLDTLNGLLIGRIVLGVGVAGAMTIATMLAADLWTGQARMKFMGKQAAVMSMGGIVFLLVGGALAEISWRGAFGIYLLALPFAVLCMANLTDDVMTKPAATAQKVKLDWGICLKIGILGFFTMAVFYLIPTRLPFLLAEIGVTSPAASGAAIAAVTLAGVPASLNFQRIRAKLSPTGIYALGFSSMFIGFAIITTANGYAQIIVGGLFVGAALGFIMPNQNMWLMSSVAPQARGRAAGVLTTFVFAGQFAGPVIAGLLAPSVGLSGLFATFAGALAVVAAIMLVISLLSRQLQSAGKPAE